MSCQFFVPRDFCRKILEHTVNISEKLTTTKKSNFTTDYFQKKKNAHFGKLSNHFYLFQKQPVISFL